MDEKNQMIQPPEDALPPAEPVSQAQSPQQAPPAPMEATHTFTPIPEPAPAPMEATQAFTPIRSASPAPMEAPQAFCPLPDPKPIADTPVRQPEVSYFDGTTFAYLGWWALGALITVLTLGIGLAWAQCMFWRYRAKHTVVCNRRLTFDGTGLQLFENYLLWGLLAVCTLGIYGLWIPFKVRAWYCSHLYMTGYRRRPSQPKMPMWRNVLVALVAVLCFALLLTGIVMAATNNLPWQNDVPPASSSHSRPPESTPEVTTTAAPNTTPKPTTAPPDTTPEPTTTPPDTTPKPTQPPKDTYTVTANSGLTLRATPVNGRALTLLPKGTEVTPEAWDDGWAKVTYTDSDGDTYTGWCSGDYLRKNSG